MTGISRKEWLLVFLWSAAVMAATAVPYLVAEGAAGPDREFGGFIWGVDDGNVYLSWVRQAADGRVLLRNQYTTKDQSPQFLHAFLYVLGRISAWTGLSPAAVFLGSRYLAGVSCLLAFYALMAGITADRTARWCGLALASVSSGLGWVVVTLGEGGWLLPGLAAFPMDVADGWQAQPEAILFLSLLLNPLFALSLGVVALTVLHGSRLASRDGYRAAVWTGLLLLVLGNIHGYDIFALHATLAVWLGCHVLARKVGLKAAAGRYAVVLILSAASPLWAYYGAHADPAYAAKVGTPTLSPRPFDVAVGYGIVLILAVAGAWLVAGRGAGERAGRWLRLVLGAVLLLGALGMVAQQQLGWSAQALGMAALTLPVLAVVTVVLRRDASAEQWQALLPVVWAACGAAVIYLPVSFQRKMLEGLHLPLCILGGLALAAVAARLAGGAGRQAVMSPGVRAALLAALVLATAPSNVLFITESLRHVLADNRTLLHVLAPPAYLSTGEVEALKWLGHNTTEHDTVLSSTLSGNYIPAYAPCLVVAGHWAETLDFPAQAGRVGRFYSTPEDAVRGALVTAMRPTLVWWGPQERLLQEVMGTEPRDPCASLEGFTEVFDNGTVRICRVETGR